MTHVVIEDRDIILIDWWAEKMEIMASKGMGPVEWMQELGLSKKEFAMLRESCDEFSKVYDRCQIDHEVFWTQLLRSNVHRREFNMRAWKEYMVKNFGYGKDREDDNKPALTEEEDEINNKYGIRKVK